MPKTPADENSSASVRSIGPACYFNLIHFAGFCFWSKAKIVLGENRSGAAIKAVSTGSAAQRDLQPVQRQKTVKWWSLAGSNR